MPQNTKCYSNKTTFCGHKLAEQPVKILIWLTEAFLFLCDIQFDRITISTFSTEKYNHAFYETLMLLDSRRHLENYHTRHSRLSNIRTSVSCQVHYKTRMTITNRSHTELNTTPIACDWTYGIRHDLSNPENTNNVLLPVSMHLA